MTKSLRIELMQLKIYRYEPAVRKEEEIVYIKRLKIKEMQIFDLNLNYM